MGQGENKGNNTEGRYLKASTIENDEDTVKWRLDNSFSGYQFYTTQHNLAVFSELLAQPKKSYYVPKRVKGRHSSPGGGRIK